MINLLISVEPMGAVRMTGRGKYVKPNARKYLSYKDFIKFQAKQQLKGKDLLTGALSVDIFFTMPIPKSWSMKKQREAIGSFHTKKPDSDNLVKSVFDSLNKIVWNDDNQVSKLSAVKVYGEKPMIEVLIQELS